MCHNSYISCCFQMCNIASKVGTEELAHFEMICAIVYQLTKDLTPEEIKESGFDQYYVDVFHAEYLGMLHQYQFFIDEEQAKNLLEVYHYEWNET